MKMFLKAVHGVNQFGEILGFTPETTLPTFGPFASSNAARKFGKALIAEKRHACSVTAVKVTKQGGPAPVSVATPQDALAYILKQYGV